MANAERLQIVRRDIAGPQHGVTPRQGELHVEEHFPLEVGHKNTRRPVSVATEIINSQFLRSRVTRPSLQSVDLASTSIQPEIPGLGIPEKARILKAEEAKDKTRAFTETPIEHIDLTSEAVQEMLDGVERFKKYNVHEQVNKDPENGALALGEGYFRVPNHDRYPFLFPHDTYFMAKADNGTPEGRVLTETALDKICKMYEDEHMIPNYSAKSALIVSARPVFLPTVWEWYQAHPEKDTKAVKDKLKKYIEVGAAEHDDSWNDPNDLSGKIGSKHHVIEGYGWLRTAGDRDAGDHYQASRELGWDRSNARFGGDERSYLAQDLQVILATNKQIVANAMGVLGIAQIEGKTRVQWALAAAENITDIRTHHFDAASGNTYDVNHITGKQSEVASSASAWMLWGDIATGDEALSIVGNLMRLDTGHGLMVTHPDDIPKAVSDTDLEQAKIPHAIRPAINAVTREANWDAKVWPNELMILTEGILNYVRQRDETHDHHLSSQDRLALTRFAIKTVQDQVITQMEIFAQEGKFAEKWRSDGTADKGAYNYEPQKSGLGWSAALAELNVTKYLPELYAQEARLLKELESAVPNPRGEQIFPALV